MNRSTITPGEVVHLFRTHPKRWIVPAIAVFAIVAIYAVVKPHYWEATQALTVRDEAAGNLDGIGNFRHTDDMKALEATIVELVNSHGVLEQALVAVHSADANDRDAARPSDAEVANLRDAIKVVPPKGAEFGTTEIFYLVVRDRSPERASALAAALSEQLQARVQVLRRDKAESMVAELGNKIASAESELEEAIARVSAVEREVGGSLGDLRSLVESSGDSPLRRKVVEIENELRKIKENERLNRDLIAMLVAAGQDHTKLLATPNRLLDSQPGLRLLKDGLVAAQLRAAELRGSMSDVHPLVVAADAAEDEVRERLHSELPLAIRGLEVERELIAAQMEQYQEELSATRETEKRLAGLRAEYANLVADVNHRTALVESARKELSEAKAKAMGAVSASLISRIDGPQVGAYPVGPSRSSLLLVGLLGGFVFGAGTLLVTVHPVQPAQSAQTLVGAFGGTAAASGRGLDYNHDAEAGLSLNEATEAELDAVAAGR